ncbi:hypothetical protein Sar04_23960 [Salinispora arenicola]|uniref:Uncharacterized protein n=1 Tax=Salinispora arenicola TaxID=168697 RepID=A0ABQ4JRS3_SALAC|nr:hypothetical protein Sar04_23960 [Salinispora arenicola]
MMPISNAEASSAVNAVSGSATAPTAEPTALAVPAVHHRQKALAPRALSTAIPAPSPGEFQNGTHYSRVHETR